MRGAGSRVKSRLLDPGCCGRKRLVGWPGCAGGECFDEEEENKEGEEDEEDAVDEFLV